MQIQGKHALKVWRVAKCDPSVRYLITPLTAMAKQQFIVDNVKEVDHKGNSVRVNHAQYADTAARYAVLDIHGLRDGKKEFKIVKDTVAEFGMKTVVRDDCWAQIPEVLKAELYAAVLEISELNKKEIEGLGFTVLSQGSDWKNAPVAKRKK